MKKTSKNKITCQYCNKEFELSLSNVAMKIKCPKCQKELCLSASSYKKLKYIRYVVVLLVALWAMYCLNLFFETKQYVGLVIVVLIMVGITMYIEQFCFWLLYKLFGVNYERR